MLLRKLADQCGLTAALRTALARAGKFPLIDCGVTLVSMAVLPARLVQHARKRILKISATWPWKEAFTICWQRLSALPAPS